MLISNAISDAGICQTYSNTLGQYLAIVLYLSESTERSISCSEFRYLHVALFIWQAVCTRRLYFQVKRPFISLNMVLVNKLCDDLSVIDLIVGAKVIRFAGTGGTSLVMEADLELRKFSNVENFNSQK